MESNETHSKNSFLTLIKFFSSNKGGKNLVTGWDLEDWTSFGEYVQEGFNQETFIHTSFNSAQEAVEFVTGIGEYSDANSFFYTVEDHEELEQEGYFQTMQCPECLEELRSQLEGESIPDEEIVDPEILPAEREYKGKSFKLDEEKYVKELWYQCRDHPEIYLMEKESWYE